MLSNGEMVLQTGPINKLVLQGEPDNVNRIWLLSVRHSGTHYMYQHVQACGYEHCIVHWDNKKQKHPTGRKQFIHAHLEVGHEYENDLNDEKCVMPLRNPVEVFKTHVYRYRWEMDTFVPYILNAFERFNEVVATRDVCVYRVDAEDQEKEFNELVAFLCTTGVYKDQACDIATNRTRPVSLHQGFTEAQIELFNNPPREIFELASEYGY